MVLNIRSASSCVVFQGLLSDEQISTCPVLILSNKIDKQGAFSEADIMSFFNLHQQLTGKVREGWREGREGGKNERGKGGEGGRKEERKGWGGEKERKGGGGRKERREKVSIGIW